MPQLFPGDADEYPTNIQAPADGDTANAASVATGLEQLADRTANLNARLSSASGAPATAAYLVASANGTLTAEVVVPAQGLALLDDTTAAEQRTTLGLGTAALAATGDFDAAGAAAAVLATSLQKASNLSDLASASSARSNLGLGTAATQASGAFDAAGSAAAAQAASQPVDADLTAIAALSSVANKVPYATGAQAWALADFTAAGRELVNDADAAAQRATLGLGTAAVLNAPASGNAASGEAVKGDDTRLSAASSYGLLVPNMPASIGAQTMVSPIGAPAFATATTGNLNLGSNADRLYAVPWIAPYTRSITNLQWELTTQHAGQVVNWAIYDSTADGYPNARLGEITGESLTGTGKRSPAFASSVAVTKGALYWLVWTTNSATTAQARVWPNGPWSSAGWDAAIGSLAFQVGTVNPASHMRVNATYAVPPTTFPTGGVFPNQNIPIAGFY